MSVNEKLTENDGDRPESMDWEQLNTPFPIEKIAPISRREEKELARKAAKKRSLRYRKPYTRKRGTVHPKKKEATRKRQLRDRWATDPFWCVCYGRGCYAMDRKLWDRHIAPLWELYDPKDLTVERYKGYGRKDRPYTVWTIRVRHKKDGIVYDGNDMLLYTLSTGSNDSSSLYPPVSPKLGASSTV